MSDGGRVMDRMTDLRLAQCRQIWRGGYHLTEAEQREILDALVAERAEVGRLRAELLSPSRGDRVPRSTALLIQTDRDNIQRDRDRLWSECMELRARCKRQDGDPTVEMLVRWAENDMVPLYVRDIARALLRAWGEEP